MKKYGAKNGSILSEENAVLFGLFLDKTFKRGGITPEAVVEKATPEASPIHHLFEWDDRKAAEKFRRTQAREFIDCVIVHTEEGDPIRAFHHVRVETGDFEYVPLDRAIQAADLWQQIVERALREAESWANRYKLYKELSPIREAIHSVLTTYKRRTYEDGTERATR